MDILLFLLAIVLLIALIIGLIKPAVVIRWGSEDKKIRKNVLKFYGIGFLICFILFGRAVSNSSSSSNTNTELTQTSQNTTKSYTGDAALIDKNVLGNLKGKNYAVKINNVKGKHIASISLDDENNSYSESICSASDGMDVVNGIKEYEPKLDKKIDTYKFTFFAENSRKFSAVIDNTSKAQITEIKLTSASDRKDIVITKKDIDDYHAKKDEEEKQKAAADKAAADKVAADKAAADKAAADKEAAEEKASYDTGITYEQLARTPDQYKNKRVKLTGKVIQVMEDGGQTKLRIAVDSNYETILLVEYPSSISSKRVLENDNVTVRGISLGLYTYKSTLGGNITIPFVDVDIIDIN